jgi:hypothetical protein
MAAPTDFLRLYQELGLAPGASLDDLRRAYRRRVSELHPDRVGMTYTATAPGAAERLQQLTALYSAATQFHRLHGRLPGTVNAYRAVPDPGQSIATAPNDEPASRASTTIWVSLVVVLILGWLIWAAPWSTDTGDESGEVPQAESAATPQSAPSRLAVVPPPRLETLKLGMPSAKVLAMQGQPVSREGSRWDYGPSWIAFDEERDRVTDWYSSPMRPLKNAALHPPQSRTEAEP